VIVAMARRLRLTLRTSDIVGRLGPSELVLAVSRVKNEQSFEAVHKRLLDKFVTPLELRKGVTETLPRVGWSLYPTNSRSVDALITLARDSMQHAFVAETQASRETVAA
jgi:GGDEF domain-containing protein